MSFKFACPNCGQRIGAAPEDVGTIGGCPSCQQKFVVPAPVDAGPKTEAVPPTVRAAAGKVAVAAARQSAIEPVTRRGLAITALILAFLPAINLIALGMAIFAVVRSDRPGRSGERGMAVAAVTIASLLVLPMNLLVPLGIFGALSVKRSMIAPATAHQKLPAGVRPSPSPARH